MELSRLWGVSLQSLANWRMRGYGPPFEPRLHGLGNKIFYRPDKIVAWLSNDELQPWQVRKLWLDQRGIEIGIDAPEAIDWLIAALEQQLSGRSWPTAEPIVK